MRRLLFSCRSSRKDDADDLEDNNLELFAEEPSDKDEEGAHVESERRVESPILLRAEGGARTLADDFLWAVALGSSCC